MILTKSFYYYKRDNASVIGGTLFIFSTPIIMNASYTLGQNKANPGMLIYSKQYLVYYLILYNSVILYYIIISPESFVIMDLTDSCIELFNFSCL